MMTKTALRWLILSAVAGGGLFTLSCASDPAADNGGAGGATAPANTAGSTTPSSTGGSTTPPNTGGSTPVGSGGGSGSATPPSGSGVSGIAVMNGYGTGSGFKGYWYTFKDTGGSTITPACDESGAAPCFAMSGASICVSGNAAQVKDMEYSKYWGAGVGWNLNQGDTAPNPAGSVSLSGKSSLSINVQMKTNSPLRIKFKLAGDTTDYCTTLRPGANSVPFSSITKECWTPGGTPLASGATVEALQLQVPTIETAATPFDFCITQLSFQ